MEYAIDSCNMQLISVICNLFMEYAIDLWNMQLIYGICNWFMEYAIDLCNMQLIHGLYNWFMDYPIDLCYILLSSGILGDFIFRELTLTGMKPQTPNYSVIPEQWEGCQKEGLNEENPFSRYIFCKVNKKRFLGSLNRVHWHFELSKYPTTIRHFGVWKLKLFLHSDIPYLTLSRIQYSVRVWFRSRFALNFSDSELINWIVLIYLLIQTHTEYVLWIFLWFRDYQKSLHSWFWNLSESVLKLQIFLKLFWNYWLSLTFWYVILWAFLYAFLLFLFANGQSFRISDWCMKKTLFSLQFSPFLIRRMAEVLVFKCTSRLSDPLSVTSPMNCCSHLFNKHKQITINTPRIINVPQYNSNSFKSKNAIFSDLAGHIQGKFFSRLRYKRHNH